MFQIIAYCDDKHLAAVLHSLNGKVFSNLSVTPVANAVPKDGSLVAPSNGTLLGMFKKYMDEEHQGDTLTVADTRKFVTSLGRKPTAANPLLKAAQEAGYVKKTGQGRLTGYRIARKRK